MPIPIESYESDIVVSRFSQESLDTLFDSTASTHNELWRSISAEEAPFVRRAITMAQEIREADIDAGDACLQGVAVALAVDRPWLTLTVERQTLRLIMSGDPDAVA